MNFRQGRHTQTTNQMIIQLPNIDNKDKAAKLVGKKVTFTTPGGKKIVGEVRSAHGNSGAVRVLFEKGLPGQSITKKVTFE
jgi:large subunit ribosomal protein L35Ae